MKLSVAYSDRMNKQNQIKRTLSQPASIAHIQSRLESSGNMNRTQLAEEFCDHFHFRDPLGNTQVAGCLKALRRLEEQGHFTLPQSSQSTAKFGQAPGQKRLAEPVPLPEVLPESADQIARLELIPVNTGQQMRTWNELMIRDHPQGERPLVGRQLRYLVKSEQGWLGGVGFSAAALHLEARDQWVGWDTEKRQENLHSVVGMTRFLIRDGVNCKNLASKVLGMAVRALPKDFEARYGYPPLLLESFVDKAHYQGTSYRAANWQWVGQTKGRGRQDRDKCSPESVKDIYVYPLVDHFRLRLGLKENAGLGPLAVTDCIDNNHWAEQEFGKAPLGDQRLSTRLVEIATNKAEHPGDSYCGATQGERSAVKAYYRFIDKPDESAVTPSNILHPHRQQTIRRMEAQDLVLCIQDGTDLNFSNLSDCSGLGEIGTNQTGVSSAGLHLHSTLAVNQAGLPLGVLRGNFSAPAFKGEKKCSKKMPVEEKKTFNWIEGLRDTMEIKARIPHTSLINILDREGDFFELFDEQRTHCSKVDLLVRAKHNRNLSDDEKLFDKVRQSPVKGTLELAVPRKSARAKKKSEKQTQRQATVSLRYRLVELPPGKERKDKQPIQLWAVHVREDNPPTGSKRLEWFLLTTLEIKSMEDALKSVEWYKLRWRIEDWHRVVKSGCGSEKLANKTAERLKRGVAINLVIGWRIMLMTLLGRASPSLPADILFSDVEINVLNAYAQKKTINRRQR